MLSSRAPRPSGRGNAPMLSLPYRIRHARMRWFLSKLLSETTRHASPQGTGAPGCRAARSYESPGLGGGLLLLLLLLLLGAAALPMCIRKCMGGGRKRPVHQGGVCGGVWCTPLAAACRWRGALGSACFPVQPPGIDSPQAAAGVVRSVLPRLLTAWGCVGGCMLDPDCFAAAAAVGRTTPHTVLVGGAPSPQVRGSMKPAFQPPTEKLANCGLGSPGPNPESGPSPGAGVWTRVRARP